MRKTIIHSLLWAALTANSVTAAETKVVLEYDAPTLKAKKALDTTLAKIPAACAFDTAPTVDLRQNKMTVADKLNKSLIGEGATAWIDAAMQQNLPIKKAQTATTTVTIVPKLHRVYSYPESMNIQGVTALELDYVVDGKVVMSKHYRGFYSKANMVSGDGEYVTTLNNALNETIPKIAADLPKVCSTLTAQG